MHITTYAENFKRELDAVIFDMDGVLLDITGSIRVVNCLAVPYYLREVLGWTCGDDLVTSADIELFKHAGGFNDDWDLTYALTLYFLTQRQMHSGLPLADFTAEIARRGGWLRAAEESCFAGLSREGRLAVEADYRKPMIRQCFQELFAGEYCERLYGYPATLYTGRAFIKDDRPLLDLAKLPKGKKLGVQTGRTYAEAMIGLEFCHLNTLIPEVNIITKRDGFHKPEPGGLALLAERLKFRRAVYIGDTLDDLRTVRNFNVARDNAARDDVQFLAALVLTGPAGVANAPLFEREGADMIAPDVNAVLDWINRR